MVTEAFRAGLGQIQERRRHSGDDSARRAAPDAARPERGSRCSLAREIASREGMKVSSRERCSPSAADMPSACAWSRRRLGTPRVPAGAGRQRGRAPRRDRPIDRRLRERTGQSAARHPQAFPLEQVTTPSLDALRKTCRERAPCPSPVISSRGSTPRGGHRPGHGFAMAYRRVAVHTTTRPARGPRDAAHRAGVSPSRPPDQRGTVLTLAGTIRSARSRISTKTIAASGALADLSPAT